MKQKIAILSILLINTIWSQDNLLKDLETEALVQKFKNPSFKAITLGNLQTTKIVGHLDVQFALSHRFGYLNSGAENFWGVDRAETNLRLYMGFWDRFQIGASRETYRKTLATSLKAKLFDESENMPIASSVYITANLNSELTQKQYPLLEFGDRMSYASQLLVSKSFFSRWSVLMAPTYVRQNLEFTEGHDHHQYALGHGSSFKISKRISLFYDASYNFNRKGKGPWLDPYALGVEFETGGHVFQLLLTNALSSHEPGFISNAAGRWEKGEVSFGFNMWRTF